MKRAILITILSLATLTLVGCNEYVNSNDLEVEDEKYERPEGIKNFNLYLEGSISSSYTAYVETTEDNTVKEEIIYVNENLRKINELGSDIYHYEEIISEFHYYFKNCGNNEFTRYITMDVNISPGIDVTNLSFDDFEYDNTDFVYKLKDDKLDIYNVDTLVVKWEKSISNYIFIVNSKHSVLYDFENFDEINIPKTFSYEFDGSEKVAVFLEELYENYTCYNVFFDTGDNYKNYAYHAEEYSSLFIRDIIYDFEPYGYPKELHNIIYKVEDETIVYNGTKNIVQIFRYTPYDLVMEKFFDHQFGDNFLRNESIVFLDDILPNSFYDAENDVYIFQKNGEATYYKFDMDKTEITILDKYGTYYLTDFSKDNPDVVQMIPEQYIG